MIDDIFKCIIQDEELGFVGSIIETNSNKIRNIISNGGVPVIAPMGYTDKNQIVNINGDKATQALAKEISPDKVIFLSEIVRFYRWFAIILGIIGVIVVLKPGTTMFSYYSFFPILFCLGFATISILIKKLSKTEPDYLISMFFTIALILTGCISYFFGWNEIKTEDIIYLFAIGICGSTGNIFLTMSIRKADISLVTPVKYLSLIFAILSGIFIFGESISYLTLLGAFLIIISTAIIFRREAIKKVKTTMVRQV